MVPTGTLVTVVVGRKKKAKHQVKKVPINQLGCKDVMKLGKEKMKKSNLKMYLNGLSYQFLRDIAWGSYCYATTWYMVVDSHKL